MPKGDLAMDRPDDVRIGLDRVWAVVSYSISSAGIIGVLRVHYAEGRTRLEAGQVRYLPSTKHRMQKTGLGEEGQVVYQACFEHMALVKVRARQALLRIVGVDDLGDCSVGTIIDGMSVGVCKTAIQAAEIPADSDLQGIVLRLADVAAVRNATDAVERTGGISRDAAGNRQVRCDGPAHRLA